MSVRNYKETVVLGSCLLAAGSLFSIAFVKGHSASGSSYAAVQTASPPKRLSAEASDTVLRLAKNEYGGDLRNSYVLIEFGDYECPPCRMLAGKVKEKTEIAGSRLKFVFKNYPLSFHPSAMPAALAAESAREQGKFRQMHDRLYTSTDLSSAGIQTLAAELKLNAAQFDRDRDGIAKHRVADDMKLFQKLKLQGTPSFVLRLPDGGAYLLGNLGQIDDFIRG